MLRLAVLETEPCAKDLIFAIAKSLTEWEWTFAHYTKISAFVKADVKQPCDILLLNEVFHTPRVFASLIEPYPKRIVIFCMNEENPVEKHEDARILYLDRRHIKDEMIRLDDAVQSLLRAYKEYIFSYQKVRIALRMQDILYIEKCDKNLIFHTLRGEFKERQTMAQAEAYFARFDFVRIHSGYLINADHVTARSMETVTLRHELQLPIARSRRTAVSDWFQSYTKPLPLDIKQESAVSVKQP